MMIPGLLVFAATLAVAAATPGPGVAAIVARVLSRGAGGSIAFAIGVGCADLVWLSCAVLGVTVLAKSFAVLFVLLKYLGAAYLLFLAWKMWHAPAELAARQAALPAASPLRMFAAGLSVNLSNPKVIIFYVALLPNLIDVAGLTLASYLAVCVTTALVLACVFGGYVALAAQARRLFQKPSTIRLMHRVSGGVMAGAAVAIAAR